MAILTSSVNAKRENALFQFTQGIEVDRRLAKSEIAVQRAWARGLVSIGSLTQQEVSPKLKIALSDALGSSCRPINSIGELKTKTFI